MRPLIGSLGIVFNTVGVDLLIRYGLPFALPPVEASAELTTEQQAEQDRRSLFGAAGLLFFIVGNLLFLMSNAWASE